MTAAQPADDTFEIGDLVNVEINGGLVNKQPVKIEKIIFDESGTKRFYVEGSNSAVLWHELRRVRSNGQQNVAADAPDMLEPNREMLEIFADGIFRHAGNDGFISLRAFYEDADKAFRITPVARKGGFKFLLDAVEDDCRRAAQFPKPVVFCPPLAVFNNRDRAREEDLLQGLALSVECDQHPLEARTQLEALLGPATVVVRSGGRCTNGSGDPVDKLHLHWRLARPARGDDLRRLKEARDLAARLVGGDPSNKPVCHPIRWPGSWHRKGEPRLCEIEHAEPDAEIDLDEALAKLRAAVPDGDARTTAGDRTPESWDTLVASIVSGKSYHAPLVSLAARLIGANMFDGQCVNLLRSIMKASTAPRDVRWQVRYQSIPTIVSSAREKFSSADTGIGLAIWNAGEHAALPPPRGWLLGNSFCRHYVSQIIAGGGSGKTSLRILQALSLATGRSLTGEHVFFRCRVLIVSLEDDKHELERRVLAARLHYGISAADVDGWLFLSAPGGSAGKLMTANARTGTVTAGTLAPHVEKAIIEYKIDLVILDPLVKAHGIPENNNELMDALAQLLSDMAAKHDVAIDIPHHVSKGAADPGNAERGRGASATTNAARLVYTLNVMAETDAQKFSIAKDDRRDYVRLDRAKLNIARTSGPAVWFKIVSCNIGNANEQYPNGDEVQTLEPWLPPETWAGLDKATIKLILDAIAAGPGGGNFYTHANAKTDRNAWEVVCRFVPEKSEPQARRIINAWLESGLLTKFDYVNPDTGRDVKGLRVIVSRRCVSIMLYER